MMREDWMVDIPVGMPETCVLDKITEIKRGFISLGNMLCRREVCVGGGWGGLGGAREKRLSTTAAVSIKLPRTGQV